MGRKKKFSYSYDNKAGASVKTNEQEEHGARQEVCDGTKGFFGPSASDDLLNKRKKCLKAIYEDLPNRQKTLKINIKGPSATDDLSNKRKKELMDMCNGSIEETKMITKECQSSNDERQLSTKECQTYLEKIWTNVSDKQSKIFSYFDCLWFDLYMKPHSKIKVLSWIKKKKVFSKKYIFVPICAWGHWFLLVLCHLGESLDSSVNPPTMLLLDSLLQAESRTSESKLRKFVSDIYASEGRKESEDDIASIPFLVPQVPQQTNGWECGYFVLYFIYRFMQRAPDSFSQTEFPYFLIDSWFSQVDVILFRDQLRSNDEKIHVDPFENEGEKVNEEIYQLPPEDDANQVVATTQKCRGYTTLRDVHGMADSKRIQVTLNSLGQPIGDGGHSFRSFFGTIARMGDKLPIDKDTWKKMPKTHKDDVWDYIKVIMEEIHAGIFIFSSIGPTPNSVWGTGSSQARLQQENDNMKKQMKELAEKMNKFETFMQGQNSVDNHASSSTRVQSPTSEAKSVQVQVGMRVSLLDLAGEEVARGVIMSEDKKRVVMGKVLGEVFYEVAVFFIIKPDAHLFVKDEERKTMGDALGSHIPWFKDYVQVDFT